MKYLKKFESILKPHRLEERMERLKKEIEERLSREVIEGDLWIDNPIYLEMESKIKRVKGNVYIKIDKIIPLWLNGVEVDGSFHCPYNNLTTLKGSPKWVGGDFRCYNNNLTTLEGSPKYVGGDFRCSYNPLTTLEGGPLSVGGDFSFFGNPLKFTEEDVRKVIDVKGIVTLDATYK